MLELSREGLYIANGKDISVLVRVVGEAPMLDIKSGVLLNDMQKDGTITILTKDNPEIQDILMNPKNYVFDYPCTSDAVNNAEGFNKQIMKNVEFSEQTFVKWTEQYKKFVGIFPDMYRVKMKAFLIRNAKFSASQADIVIRQIEIRLKR